jgi:hypothetical protein
MGNAANISAKEVEALAGRLEALTATEAESIQEGANLLLTFGNISNQLGEGNDIFTQTTEIMVDFARVMRKGPADAAIQLGKALNDPTTGMTALRKAGVSFTEQQQEQIKALQSSGDLLAAQKVILAELQKQFGGSGAAYAKTFSGQLELMGHELGTIGEEATMAVMPALQGMVEQLRLLIPEIGPKLKAAIESVDWKGLTTAIVDVTTFFIENIETIGKVVVGIFLLNTAFKLMAVASGIANVALLLTNWVTAQLATGMTVATIATNLLRSAMLLLPFAILATGFIIGANAARNLTTELEANKIAADSLNPELNDLSYEAEFAGGKFGYLAGSFSNAGAEARKLRDELIELQGTTGLNPSSPNQAANRERRNALRDANRRARQFQQSLPNFNQILSGGGGGASAAPSIPEALTELIAAQSQAANAEQGILDKRVSAFESFNNSVKTLFGQIKDSILSSFTLPTLGNSVNSITRNIAKLLERTRGFASSISQLSGLGLNSSLLQQVIQSGPIAGSKLASAIVGGGSAFISQLNSAYGEFGSLASGIAGTGTTSAFGTQQTVNNYSIEVTGGLATGSDVGRAVVNAIRDYERQSGAAWRA